jgi:hypothetical protein
MIILVLLFDACSKRNEKNWQEDTTKLESNIKNNAFSISQDNNTNVLKDASKEIIGTYLNEPYLNYLKETRSHTISINRVKRELHLTTDQIIIKTKSVLFIYNLHEGVDRRIEYLDENSIILEDDKLIIDDGNIYYNDIKYIKVTDDIEAGPRDDIGVKQFITDIIFDNKIYVNSSNDELFSSDSGSIIYKNIEYGFTYSYLLQNKKYDELSPVNPTRTWPPESYWIEVIDHEIKIYTIILPEDPDIDFNQTSEFIIYDILKEKL